MRVNLIDPNKSYLVNSAETFKILTFFPRLDGTDDS